MKYYFEKVEKHMMPLFGDQNWWVRKWTKSASTTEPTFENVYIPQFRTRPSLRKNFSKDSTIPLFYRSAQTFEKAYLPQFRAHPISHALELAFTFLSLWTLNPQRSRSHIFSKVSCQVLLYCRIRRRLSFENVYLPQFRPRPSLQKNLWIFLPATNQLTPCLL